MLTLRRRPTEGAVAAGDVPGAAIVVAGLRKSYGGVEAVRGIDFTVKAGEVFALLGPNGAGKTSTVEMITGFRRRDAGEIRVLGVDPARSTAAWRRRLGIAVQGATHDPQLTVRETVRLLAGLYGRSRTDAETALEECGLTELGERRTAKLSGGEARRLDLAVAIVGRPELLILDEPTAAIDPMGRRTVWTLLRRLVGEGTTVLMTSHDMAEVTQFASRVAIVVGGRIVAEESPGAVAARVAPEVAITFVVPAAGLPEGLPQPFDVVDGIVTIRTADATRAVGRLSAWAVEHDVRLDGLTVNQPSLEEAYLRLTAP